MHLVTEAKSPIEFFYKISKSILEHGEKSSGIVECLNTYSEITTFEETEWTKKATEIFLEVMGDRQLTFSKKVTFIEPTKEHNILSDEDEYNFVKLPTADKRDSYWGRLIGQCGGATRNQFERLIAKLKQGKNSKTAQVVVFRETDIFNAMSQPCLISINATPRDGMLTLTGNFRSMGISKAGLGDALGLLEMAQFLSKESSLQMEKICIISHSSHLRQKNGELKDVKVFLERVDKECAGL